MIERLRRIAPELLVATLAVAAALFVAGRALGDGFPLDDAWIHLEYGLAFRRTATLGYNDGIASTGCTSPLWALFAAAAHVLAGASGPSMAAAAWAKAMGVALHAATAVLSARLARACVRRRWATPAALGAGGIVATASVLDFAAVSGMEVALTSALLVGAALASVRARGVAGAVVAGGLAGLAVVARPECVVFVPAVVAVIASRASGRAALVRGAQSLGAAALPIAALVARNYAVSKLPLPATFYVKANPEAQTLASALRAGFVDVLGQLRPTSRVAFWILVGVAIALGAVALVRRVRSRPARALDRPFAVAAFAGASLAYLIGVAAINVVRNPTSFYYQRYFAPPMPLLAVAGACAAIALAEIVAKRARGARAIAVVLTAVAFSAAIVDDVAGLRAPRDRYADDVTSINGLQVAVGKFIGDHVSPDGVVWTVDAGAVRYWGQRRTVDLVRLNTREVFHGNKVPKEWWPEAIAVIPEVFQTAAPADLMDSAFVTLAPLGKTEEDRRLWRQEVHLCRKTAYEHPDNRVLVFLYKTELVAVGRCAPK